MKGFFWGAAHSLGKCRRLSTTLVKHAYGTDEGVRYLT